jgi:hypothetical protein
MGRWSLTFGIAATVFMSLLGPPSAAAVDLTAPPDARLQIVINSVYIRDDQEFFGSGDMDIETYVCYESSTGGCKSSARVSWGELFGAGTGDTKVFDRVVPVEGDEVSGGATTQFGIPVYADERYLLRASMREDHDMGAVTAHLTPENNWELGRHTVRSLHDDGSPGDYDLTFEIRRTPLPDLRINGVREIVSNDGHFYCVQVENIGEMPSYPAPLAVEADFRLVREVSLKELGVNEITEHCVIRSELPPGQVQLRFTIDEPQQIAEMDEDNQPYVMTIPALPTAGAPAASASPEPAAENLGAASQHRSAPGVGQAEPNTEQADLTVRAIKVNGQAPDGKDACKPGKNTMTVVVKNAGKGDVDSFTVRLAVDGGETDSTVDFVRAGEEREVEFDGVQLKAGQHTLKAVADPERTIDESKDDNNELKVAVTCKG